jgi:general L-amino acid transport system permease protein
VILSFGSFAVSLAGLASLALLLVAGLLSLLHALAQNDAASQAALRAWLFGSLSLTAIIALLNLNFGLEPVETQKWGGLMVTLVVSVTGIAASLPIGILLALGRRSKMPIVRLFSVLFIELWRGVPLITVLFMSSVMLPLFLPPGTSFDKLLRALIGVGLFSAAYMAEVVRSGLQAIPRGQYEGANALGLSYWQTMRMIILPQALKVSIPNIVGNFISLFKDTTLVSIIGLFDLLGIVRFSLTDANWASPASAPTGYFSLAMIFWVFCFGMSRYSIFMERRLQAGQKR